MAHVKYFFIINPNAGRRREQKKILKHINRVCTEKGVDFTVYNTLCAGDGGEFMRKTAEASGGEDAELRFIFCGGDGTVMEAANAFMKIPEEIRRVKVAAGVIPVGTGNDFIRNFGGAKLFLDIEKQISGSVTDVDLMQYGEEAYGANMFNIGFDAQVVKKVNELRGRPYMTKRLAYPIGVLHMLRRMPHTNLKITFDDGEVREGHFLLNYIANGAYCGGGFYAASEAKPDDGLLDVLIVNPINRRQFLKMIGSYRKGTFIGTEMGNAFSYFRKCRSLTIEAPGSTDLCVDGEIEPFEKITITAQPKVFRFLVPDGGAKA